MFNTSTLLILFFLKIFYVYSYTNKIHLKFHRVLYTVVNSILYILHKNDRLISTIESLQHEQRVYPIKKRHPQAYPPGKCLFYLSMFNMVPVSKERSVGQPILPHPPPKGCLADTQLGCRGGPAAAVFPQGFQQRGLLWGSRLHLRRG